MVKLRKFLCILLSASFCVNSASFAVKRKQISNNSFTNIRGNRSKVGRGLSDSMLGNRQCERVSNDFKKYGKIIGWEEVGNGVKLFFKDGKVRVFRIDENQKRLHFSLKH